MVGAPGSADRDVAGIGCVAGAGADRPADAGGTAGAVDVAGAGGLAGDDDRVDAGGTAGAVDRVDAGGSAGAADRVDAGGTAGAGRFVGFDVDGPGGAAVDDAAGATTEGCAPLPLAGTVRCAGGVGPGMIRTEVVAVGAALVEEGPAGAALVEEGSEGADSAGRGAVGKGAVLVGPDVTGVAGADTRLTIMLLWNSLRLPGQLQTPINNNSSRINKTQRRLPLFHHGGIC